MGTGSALLDLLNSLLKGCGAESQKMEIFGLLRDVARYLAEEGESVESVRRELRDVALMIAGLRQRAGLETDVEAVLSSLEEAVERERVMLSVPAVRRRLARRRAEGRGGERGVPLL